MGSKSNVNRRQPEAAGVQLSQSSLGVAIGVVYGRLRVPGNVIFLGTRAGSGFGSLGLGQLSAGFGGASAPTQLEVFYFVSVMYALSEGPIEGVRTIYKRDTRVVLDKFDQPVGPPWGPPDNSASVVIPPTHFAPAKVNVFLGKEGQPAWLEDSINALQFEDINGTFRWDFLHPEPALHYPFLALLARHAWPLVDQLEANLMPDVRTRGAAMETLGALGGDA